jgi:hypothetical protein
VAAVGILTLSVTDPVSTTARTIITQAAMPVALSGDEVTSPAPGPVEPQRSTATSSLNANSRVAREASAQGCETLSLVLGPVDLDLLGMTVQLNQMNVDFISRSSGRQGIVMCGATGVINGGVSPVEQMKILNMLLDAVG